MRALLATLSLAAGLLAQRPLLEIDLAADPNKSGPRAWTWVRTELLVRLPAWPTGRNPLASMRLRITDAETCEILDGTPTEGTYLEARGQLAQTCTIEVTGKFSGVETWNLRGKPAGRLANLVDLLGLDLGRTPLTFDCLAVTSTILGGTVEGDPLGRLITWGAEECGEVDLLFWHTDDGIVIRGASSGGVILPAALTVLADWHSHPSESFATSGRKVTRADHLVLFAIAARNEERDEAIRQLSILDDPRAIMTLEHLLLEDDHTRVLAMESLVRARAAKALPRLLAAASDNVEDSEAMAQVALWSLWQGADSATRRQIRAQLDPSMASALDAWHQGDQPPLLHRAERTPSTTGPSRDLHRAAWVGLWVMLGALGWIYLRGKNQG